MSDLFARASVTPDASAWAGAKREVVNWVPQALMRLRVEKSPSATPKQLFIMGTSVTGHENP